MPKNPLDQPFFAQLARKGGKRTSMLFTHPPALKVFFWGFPPDPCVWTGHMVDGCSETWWTHLSMLGIVPEVKLGDLMSGEEDVSRLHRQLSAE